MTALYPDVGPETLEATPERLLKYLLAVSRYPSIRRRLMLRGYSKSQQDYAYSKLAQLGSFGATPNVALQSDPEVKDALSEINRNDEDILKLVGSALRYKFPEQHEFMLSGLQSSTDEGQASQTVGTVLDRMTQLQSGQSPEATRAKAKDALEAMAQKGLDKVWRAKFAALCNTVRAVPDDVETREAALAREQARHRVLLEVRAFFEEWADTARVEFKGRRDLIRLGLAQPRRSDATDEAELDDDTTDQGPPSPATPPF